MFRDHILACFITDPSGLVLRDRIGMDIIAWECDYPHTDTTWPESPEFAWAEFQDSRCTDGEIHKITWENACRFFSWDPFKHTQKGAGVRRGIASGDARRGRDPDVQGRVARAQRGSRHRRNLIGGAGPSRRPREHEDAQAGTQPIHRLVGPGLPIQLPNFEVTFGPTEQTGWTKRAP